MGYIRHHAILVTKMSGDPFDAIVARAREIFAEGSIAVLGEAINGYRTLLIGPDGSKEGWDSSDEGDRRRGEFIGWLAENRIKLHFPDWVEVQYGGDDSSASVSRNPYADEE